MSLNHFHRWLTRNFATTQRRPVKAKSRQLGLPSLSFETLEDRTVPTVLFAPQFGNESLQSDGGQRINSPAVYVVLWGSSWGGIASPTATQVGIATTGVVNSHYLDGVAQYGVTTKASIKSFVYDNTPDPASGFTQKNLTDEIARLVANKQLPNPANTPNMIVDMVTAPNITSSVKSPSGVPAGGYNNAIYSGTKLNYGFIWNGTSAGSLSLQDSCSLVFSHEMAESMTDPAGLGYNVNKGVRWPGIISGAAQIGDYEGNSYQYRLGTGILVQPFWSGAVNSPFPNQWLVTDGNAQTINVIPNWTIPNNGSAPSFNYYNVTVNGSQLSRPSGDYISVAHLGADLVIVLNNELFLLDSLNANGSQQLGTLTTNITKGLVHINGSPIMTGITINGRRGTEVDVASNALVLTNISINDVSTVSIGRSENTVGRISVAVNSPHVLTTLTMDDRSDLEFNYFFVTGSTINSNGFNVTYNASQIQNFLVMGGIGGSQVFLGDQFHPLDTLSANITVTGNGTKSTLSIDGTSSADTEYEINKGTVNAYGHLLRPKRTFLTNQIHYSNLSGLEVDGGAAGNTFTVNGTDAFPTTLNTGSGADNVQINGTSGALIVKGRDGSDTVNIGSNGSVRNIGNTLTVTNTDGFSAVIVDDSADKIARTAIIYNNGFYNVISGLTPGGDILLRGANLSSLLIRAGSGGNTFRIHDTPDSLTPGGLTTTVSTGAGNDMVTVDGTTGTLALDVQKGSNNIFVGGTNGSLDRILGAVNMSGSGTNNTLTFNDQVTTTQENYSLAVDKLTRIAADGSTADMAPLSFTGFQAVTLNVGNGGSATSVTGSLAGSTLTVNGNAGGQNQFAVDASSNAILGPVFLHGGNANADFAQYYDIGNAAPHTYTLASTSISRDGQAPVFLSGVFGTILYAPIVGGNTINVRSVALGAAYKIQAANGDHVTVGSLAPGLGSTLANILDQVNVVSYTPYDAVTLVVDDSGNTDTTMAKHITFSLDGDGNVSMVGLTPIALSWQLSSASSVTVWGGVANTIFSMQPFVAATPLTIVGGTGINTLDYSSYPTDVSVNLQTGTATDLAGIRDPKTGRITIQNVIGGSGNDTLTAGADRSILIGNGAADQLFGGSGENILIDGTTDYTQPNLNAAALDAIFQEWNRTDLSFDSRMSDLLTGSNSQGIMANNFIGDMAILLNSTTVHDDLAAAVLTGGTGRDWYLIDAADLIKSRKLSDVVTMV